jgi:hypothetical protein
MDTNPLSVFIGQEQAAMIGVPTIFNQASFDSLPLVEFIPHKSLNPKRVHELLRMDPPNAMMKAVTKAKRRAVLALCGLGISDESEIEDNQQHPASKANSDQKQSRIENIVNSEVSEAEIVDQVPEQT